MAGEFSRMASAVKRKPEEQKTESTSAFERMTSAVKQNPYVSSPNARSSAPQKGGTAAEEIKPSYLETARNVAKATISTGNDLFDKDRKKKLNELTSQLDELKKQKMNLDRMRGGAMRGNAKSLIDQYDKQLSSVSAQMAELEKQLNELTKPAMISERDQLADELKAAKENRNQLGRQVGQYAGEAGGRALASVPVEDRNALYSEKSAADLAVKKLERQLEQIDYAKKMEGKTYEDTFTGQFGANRQLGRLGQDVNAAFNRYLMDPTEENKAYAYTLMELEDEFQRNNEAALDDEGAILPWISKSAANYLPQFYDNAKAELGGGAVGALGGIAAGNPVMGARVGASVGAGIQSYNQMRGAAFRELVAGGMDENTAREACQDEAFISGLIESFDTFLSFGLLGTGKALNAIGAAALKSGSKNAAVKAVAGMFGKSAADKMAEAAAKEAGKSVLRKGAEFAGGLLLDAAGEYAEEFSQSLVSNANQNREGTGKWDLVKETAKTTKDAFTGKNDEALKQAHAEGVEGFKIGLMFGGAQAVTNQVINNVVNAKSQQQRTAVIDMVLHDEESLNALVQDGKESGEGSVSAQIATEIEQKMESGEEVTRHDVQRLIASNEVYIEEENRNTAQDEAQAKAEAVTRQAQDFATKYGYGEHGKATLTSMIENQDVSPDMVNEEFHLPYLYGMSNKNRSDVNLTSKLQEEAFNAGKLDQIMSMKRQTDRSATVWGKDGGLIQNDFSKNLDKQTSETLQTIGRATGTKIIMEEIPAEQNANGYYRASDGTIHLDVHADNPVITVMKHELTHRMQNLAPKEYTKFRDYAVQAMSSGLEEVNGSIVERMQQDYYERSNGQVQLTVEEAMDEIAANFTEKILTDEKSLHDFVAEMNTTEEKRSVGQKFFDAVHEFIQRIKAHFGNGKAARAKMDAESMKQFGATVAELEKAEKLWKEAYRAAEQNVKKRANESVRTDAGRDTMSYSLKEGVKHGQENQGTPGSGGENRRAGEERILSSLRMLNGGARPVHGWAEGGLIVPKQGSVAYNEALVVVGEYGLPVFVVNDSVFDQNHSTAPAFSAGGQVFMRETLPKNGLGDIGAHEAGHAMKQLHFAPYIDFLPRVKSMMNDSDLADVLKDGAAKHCHVDLNHCTKAQEINVYDEICNMVIGASHAKRQSDLDIVRGCFKDFDGYLSELQNIHEQFKASRLANTFADESTGENVQYSLKDSDGRSLTKQQHEFFQDSKAVDQDGNLLVLYHGTGTEFTVFDKGRVGENYGDISDLGFYFTPYKDDAVGYASNVASKADRKVMESYLNLKNPLVVEDDGWGSAAAQADQRHSELLRWAKDGGHDGIIVRSTDEIMDDNGTADAVYIAFSSEQVKDVKNQRPTSDPDIRFSLKKPVEETKDLVALHNLTEQNLVDALKLGGMPMPSIAVVKAQTGHSKYGPISLVFSKDTIDPQADNRNKVYGGDGWTPTAPTIEFEVNEKAARRISDKYYGLANRIGYDAVRPLYDYVNDLERQLNSKGGESGIIESLRDNTDMMNLYLQDIGKKKVEDIQKETVTRIDDDKIAQYDYFIEKLGEDTINELRPSGGESPIQARKRWTAAHGEELENVYRGYLRDLFNMSDEEIENTMESPSFSAPALTREVIGARNYLKNGPETKRTEYDSVATKDAIRKAVNKGAYQKWLTDLFSGIEGRKGIYNGKDPYTSTGDSRSWGQLHYAYTLENIVKAMKGTQEERGQGAWGLGATTLQAVAAPDYGSIQDIKADSGRLGSVESEEYTAKVKAVDDQITAIIDKISKTTPAKDSNSFINMDYIGEALKNAASGKHTIDAIVRSFSNDGYKISTKTAKDIQAVYKAAADLPTEYFEAKPQRAVGFDEVLAAVVPDNTGAELRSQLEEAGLNVLTYKAEDERSRVEAINSVDNARFSLKGQKDLERENAKLRETVSGLREQFKTTKFAKVDKKSLDQFTKRLLKDYSSGADINETRSALDSLYTYIANGENGDGPVWSEAYKRAFETARDILSSASVVDDEMYQQYKSLRDRLRTTGITISDQDANDLAGYEGIQDFRRRNAGRLKVVKSGGIPVDSLYQDLADTYPELFDQREYSTPGDQLVHIADVLDDMRPVEVNPYSVDMRENASWLANDILERFYELPQAKPTFADKAESKLTGQVIKDAKKLEKLRTQKNERIAQLIAENRQKVKDTQAKERGKRADALQQIKDHYKAKEAKSSESRKAQVLRAKIVRHANEMSQKLLKPSDKHHIPDQLRGPVASLLEAINRESAYELDENGKRVKPGEGVDITKRTAAFRELKARYAEIAKDEGGSMVIDPALLGDSAIGFQGDFDSVLSIGDIPMASMNTAQLDTIWRVLRAVEHSVSTAGKVLSESKFQGTVEWANAIKDDTSTRRSRKGKFSERIRVDLETPYTYFSHFGESGHAIYRMLRDAQDHQQIMVEEVNKAVREIVDPKTVQELNKQTHQFTTERGEKLTLTTAQVMEVYELMKREQAVDHLMKGGIVQPEIKNEKIMRGTDAILLSANDLQAIVKVLTNDQAKVADGLQKITTGLLADYGNEASMKAYGYKKFTGKDYWPIKSAKEAVHSNVEKGGNNTRSIKNIGMAKAVMPHASNPLDIGGIFKTFANHTADMTDYAAWLCPMEDANRLYNFQFRDEMGNQTGKTIKGLLDRVGGAGAQQYWANLVEDIQNGINFNSDSAFTNVTNKVIGNAKGAAVGANLRVVIQQPTAIMRANAVLNPADITKGLFKGVTKGSGWQKAVEHSAIAMRKDMGGFDISNPMQMNEILFDDKSKLRKFNDAMGKGAELGDSVTWGKIWNACEWAAMRENPNLSPGSADFFKAVDAIFTEVIDQTQVVDGVLQRSQTMRSGNTLVKQATAFMGEPTMSMNLLMRAYDNLVNETNPKKRGKAIKVFGRASLALAANCAVNALAQSLVDAIRDDDEDKDYWERFWAAFLGDSGNAETPWGKAWNRLMSGNMEDNLNPVQYVPFAKDVFTILQGYDVTRADADVMGDILRAFTTFQDSMSGDGKRTIGYATKQLAQQIGKAFGVSAPNVLRDIWGAVRTAAVETGNIPLQYEMEKAIYNIDNSGNKGRFIDILYRAYKSGDKAVYDHIVQDMIDNGIEAESIESGIRSRSKKDKGEVKVPDSFSAAIGIKPEKYTEEQGDKFSANDLTSGQYTKYTDERGDMLTQIVQDFQAHGFGELDEETASNLMGAAYKFAEENALEIASGGTYESDTKWVNKAQDAPRDLGMSEAEYIRLMQEYSAASIAADGVYDAHNAGIDVELYLEFKRQAGKIKADKDKSGKTISGSKEKKVKALVNSLVNSEREYWYLMGTEYESYKDNRKYKQYFGK